MTKRGVCVFSDAVSSAESGPSVKKMPAMSDAAFLHFSVQYWGNASITAQCDNLMNYSLPLSSSTAEAYRVCLAVPEVTMCTVKVSPAGCLGCGVHRQWQVPVVSGRPLLNIRVYFLKKVKKVVNLYSASS